MTSQILPMTPDSLAITPDSFPINGRTLRLPAAVHSNGEPLTLAEVIDHEAMGYRAWGTPAGDFLARQMDRLAQLVRWTDAQTPEEHEARMEVWDQEIRDQWFDRGYHEGQEAGRREACRAAHRDWE